MERSVSVLKFGGTSVGSGERIRRVAHIVTRQAQDSEEGFPAVVVSAMAGVTDALLRIARFAAIGEPGECGRELEALHAKHLEAVEKVVHGREARAALREELAEALVRLRSDVEALQLATDGDARGVEVPRLTATVSAWGERLSVLLVTAAVRDCGVEAGAVREEIILTGMPHLATPYVPGTVGGAEPLSEETRQNARRLVEPLLERQIVPVMAGFIGRTLDGFVTTLGRNGSDYSAAVIGAALDCAEVNIYTDVDGVLTADPRIVQNARLLPRLSYAEAAQLSWFGAKVLHPRTLIPVAPRNIPVRVRNTFRPAARGTVVGPVHRQSSGAAAITVRHHLALITVESKDLFGNSESVSQVFALMAHAGITPVAICSSSGHHLAFMVEEQAAESVVALLQRDLENWHVRSQANLAACACIGSGFTNSPMSPARAVTALAHERIPVITEGASDLGILLIVEERDSERALRCLHRDLIAPVIPLVRHIQQEKRRETREGREAREALEGRGAR